MLIKNIYRNIMIMYILVFSISCKFVDFTKLKVDCSIPRNNEYFLHNEVEITFSLEPERKSLNEIIELQKDCSSVDFEVRLEGNKAFVKPVELWQKGTSYSIEIQGDLKLAAGGSHSVHFFRSFFYGEPKKNFGLLNWTAPATTNERAPLLLEFSAPISIPSFTKNFSLTPQRPFDFYVEKNGCKVVVVPQEAWDKNQRFNWVLNQFEDVDGYLLGKQYQGNFIWNIDTEIPCVERVVPVLSINDNDLIVQAQDNDLLFDNQPLLLCFTKDMDFNSVKDGINIEPNIAGELQRGGSEKEFVWVPEENWNLGEEYRLVISNDVTDLSGNQLIQDEEFYFTVSNQFLQVTSIQLGEGDIQSQNFDSGSLKEVSINDEKSTVITTITFSQPLCIDSLQNDLSSISMDPLFPVTAGYPILEQVSYTENIGLILHWTGFSPSTSEVSNFYRLKIAGGVSGLKTDAGNYLKEDVCLNIQVLQG